MGEPISILDVLKRGGYEASLITTFNATLPFYEELVLRRLMAAGSRYNVVLMDGAQCAQAWASESARPRLAGHAYTLVPMRTNGAFHPKICLLMGPKKASLLIGSHNLTLSGFGYNREVTNWIEVGGARDTEGVGVLADTWSLIEQWVQQQRPNLPTSVIDSVLTLANFVSPLTQKTKATGISGVLGQAPGNEGLLEQVARRVPKRVTRIVVMGAFFDASCAFLRELESRWPEAEVIVLIDPETVQLGSDLSGLRSRFVSARVAWADSELPYLHAKAVYFETEAGGILVSGSANPSRPAWLANATTGNVEAVLLRDGQEARETAEALGLMKAFACETLDLMALKLVVDRSKEEGTQSDAAEAMVCVAVADDETDSIVLSLPAGFEPASVAACGSGEADLLVERFTTEAGGQLRVWLGVPIAQLRSLIVRRRHGTPIRALVHHPAVLSGLSHTKRQAILRAALGELGSGEGDVTRLIAAVEKVIFSDEVGSELRAFARKEREGEKEPTRPESLSVHIADLPKQRKKQRLLKSGDLAYLLDVLIKRLGLETEGSSSVKDRRGRSEEEAVGQDDEVPPEVAREAQSFDDVQIAEVVARKARTLVRRMMAQIDAAANEEGKAPAVIVQLVAVLGLLRELRRLRLAPRWRMKQSLVHEADRRALLEKSMAWLFGRNSMALPKILNAADEPLEEVSYLRALLLWLAWDLGEELTDRISPLMDANEVRHRVRTNAVLYELLPSATRDLDEAEELERSIRMTVLPTGEEGARAATWLTTHLSVGRQVLESAANGDGFGASPRVGSLTLVPGSHPSLHRVVSAIAGSEFSIWEFDGERSFIQKRAELT